MGLNDSDPKKTARALKAKLPKIDKTDIADKVAHELVALPSFKTEVVWKLIRIGTVGTVLSCASLVSVGIGFAVWLGSQASKQITSLKVDLTNHLSIARSEMTNEIVRQFDKPRIKETLTEVARNQATNIMISEISPVVSKFKEDLQQSFNEFEKRAQTNLNELRTLNEFSLLVTKAQGDDALAFDELVKIGHTDKHPFLEIARQAFNGILWNLELERLSSVQPTSNPWERTSLTPETAALSDYHQKLFTPLNSPQRITLVRQCYAQERFPIKDRLEFLVRTIQTAVSLRARSLACMFLNEHAKLNKTVIAWPEYIAWFEGQQKQGEPK